MNYSERVNTDSYVADLKSKDLSDRQALDIMREFCFHMASVMGAITKGRALADVHFKERKNIIMTNVDLERLLASFEVADAVFDNVFKSPHKNRKIASEAMAKGSDFYEGFRKYKEFLDEGRKKPLR